MKAGPKDKCWLNAQIASSSVTVHLFGEPQDATTDVRVCIRIKCRAEEYSSFHTDLFDAWLILNNLAEIR